MTPEHIAGHLKHVLTEEQIPFEDPALWLLARAADGSMRDALSLTDQAIAFGNQTLAASDVSSMLGTIDQRDIERLVEALVGNDGPQLLAEINRIADFAPDYGVILADLLALFHRVTMEQVVPGSVDNALGDADQVKTLARRLSAEDAQLFYQAALMGRKDLAVTPDARMGFEMTLLRMLAFRPAADRREPPAAPARHASSEGVSAPKDEPEPARSEPDHPPAVREIGTDPRSVPDPVSSAPEQAPAGLQKGTDLRSVPESAPSAPRQSAAPEPVDAEPPPDDSWYEAAMAGGSDELDDYPVAEPALVEAEPVKAPSGAPAAPEPAAGEFYWPRDFRSLGIVGMPGNLASHAALSQQGDTIVLTLDEGHARLLNERHEARILEGLRQHFGESIRLRVEQGDAAGQTPAVWEERERIARQQAAEEAIREDPVVKSIVERFEARVVEESIRPI